MKKWIGLLVLVVTAIGGAIGGVYYFQSKKSAGKVEVAQQNDELKKTPPVKNQQDQPKKLKTGENKTSYVNYFINRKIYLQKRQRAFQKQYQTLLHTRRNVLTERLIQKLKGQ